MVDIGLTGLILAYCALAALLISLYFYSNWSIWIKLGATLAVAFFFYTTYISIPPLLGWPTSQSIPKQFRLIAHSLDEKGKNIFIWANDLKYGVELRTPRAYRLPYNPKLAEQVDIAGAKIRRGGAIIGEVQEPKRIPGPDGKIPKELAPKELKINFIDAPEALIPEIE